MISRVIHAAPSRPAPPCSLSAAGNLLGLLVSPFIVLQYGWRTLFCIFGALGLPLLIFWLASMPDRAAPPSTSTSTSAAATADGPDDAQPSDGRVASSGEAGASGRDVNVFTLMSSSATWAIIIVNFINHWGYFIYLNWMPSYFKVCRRGGCVCVLGGGDGVTPGVGWWALSSRA